MKSKTLSVCSMLLVVSFLGSVALAQDKPKLTQEQKLDNMRKKHPECAEIIDQIKTKQAERETLRNEIKTALAKENEEKQKEKLAKLEELKKTDPEKYAKVTARMEERKKNLSAKQANKIKISDEERLAKQKELHPQLAATFNRMFALDKELKELRTQLKEKIKSSKTNK